MHPKGINANNRCIIQVKKSNICTEYSNWMAALEKYQNEQNKQPQTNMQLIAARKTVNNGKYAHMQRMWNAK